ncbi:hypothetical protein ABZS66_22590 [Dactylosporangium sp. NPDC005572]|uniref:hypothetical protein n=1 Tax=Dactylosporangium sp. NPDC005572 TaxID=3156889 RepID=UPI0033AE6AA9
MCMRRPHCGRCGGQVGADEQQRDLGVALLDGDWIAVLRGERPGRIAPRWTAPRIVSSAVSSTTAARAAAVGR